MRSDQVRIKCPTCGKPVVHSARCEAPFLPFCSKRCRLIDLGKWFDGEHRIEGRSERPPEDFSTG